MVDFSKHLTDKNPKKIVDPIKLYETLDRAHDKGPLRPAQTKVLEEWFLTHRQEKDVILKLHTGQGKTLCGLLMLQSRLNDSGEPVLYLCPNNFLIEQTCDQAKQFGIATCTANPELPDDFLNGKSILVTSVQKLFNGLTKFGLQKRSIPVDTLLMDDAHTCSDIIRQACRIRIPNDDQVYNELLTLFETSLEKQGVGTFADIGNNRHDALLPVPYWDWIEKEGDVARILSNSSDKKTIKFVWSLIKDNLKNCQCVISGTAIEIEPFIPPLEMFETYWNAEHRIFMSATVTDDSFLIKGLQLSPNSITNPLAYEKESWSGEKMILIPALIHENLDRGSIVQYFGTPDSMRKYGVVALAPSFSQTEDWKKYGATVASKNDVLQTVADLKNDNFENSVVLVNRYDGIDLPDDSCRVLIIDRKPYSESLIDLHQETCRANSLITIVRNLRSIEQGLGRSVRGEKDYSVIVIIGTDITRLLRDKKSKNYLSNQMNTQINIGLNIAEIAQQDIENRSNDPLETFKALIRQCISRDSDWKDFYTQKMNSVTPSGSNQDVLELYKCELNAEKKYQAGNYQEAIDDLQALLDKDSLAHEDQAWYLQEMARYSYNSKRTESRKLQVNAHKKNHLLLRPPSGITVSKLTIVSEGRMERIIQWVKQYDNYKDLDIALSDILSKLEFGVKADHFEQALNELSVTLGFKGERPDKEWKEGPDNLWVLDDTKYILWECKNQVKSDRANINKREAEQMNRSCAWFEKHYSGYSVKNIMIHPSKKIESAASFINKVQVMRVKNLKQLVKKVSSFYKSFEAMNFTDLSPVHIQQLVDEYKLSVGSIIADCVEDPRDLKNNR